LVRVLRGPRENIFKPVKPFIQFLNLLQLSFWSGIHINLILNPITRLLKERLQFFCFFNLFILPFLFLSTFWLVLLVFLCVFVLFCDWLEFLASWPLLVEEWSLLRFVLWHLFGFSVYWVLVFFVSLDWRIGLLLDGLLLSSAFCDLFYIDVYDIVESFS